MDNFVGIKVNKDPHYDSSDFSSVDSPFLCGKGDVQIKNQDAEKQVKIDKE